MKRNVTITMKIEDGDEEEDEFTPDDIFAKDLNTNITTVLGELNYIIHEIDVKVDKSH